MRSIPEVRITRPSWAPALSWISTACSGAARSAKKAILPISGLTLSTRRSAADPARSWCSRSGRTLNGLAESYGANIKLVEDPPGPPVRATVVAEIYGPDYNKQREIARDIKALFAKTDQVVDIDDSVQEKQDKYQLIVDKEKAALAGISTEQIVQTLRLSVAGMAVSTLHRPDAKNPVAIMLRLPKGQRTGIADMDRVYLMSQQGSQVPLSSLVTDRAVGDGQG